MERSVLDNKNNTDFQVHSEKAILITEESGNPDELLFFFNISILRFQLTLLNDSMISIQEFMIT